MSNTDLIATYPSGLMKVGQANELLDYAYRLSPDAFRLLFFALKNVTYKDDWNGDIRISPSVYAETLSIEPRRAIQHLKSSIDQLVKNPIKYPYCHDGEVRIIDVFWLSKKDTPVSRDSTAPVLLSFNRDLLPYLCRLEEHYTAVEYEHVRKFKSYFALRLYLWLKREYGLNRNKSNGMYSIVLNIQDMCEMAGVSFTRWAEFNRSSLTPAIDQINAYTDVVVKAIPEKTGRSITRVRFNYRFSSQFEHEDSPYVEEYLPPQKPTLQRLSRKPKDESKQQKWAEDNYVKFVKYESELKLYDQNAKLTISQLRKAVMFGELSGASSVASFKKELDEREAELTAKKNRKLEAAICKIKEAVGEFKEDFVLSSCSQIKLDMYWADKNLAIFIKDKFGKDQTQTLSYFDAQARAAELKITIINVELQYLENNTDELLKVLKPLYSA